MEMQRRTRTHSCVCECEWMDACCRSAPRAQESRRSAAQTRRRLQPNTRVRSNRSRDDRSKMWKTSQGLQNFHQKTDRCWITRPHSHSRCQGFFLLVSSPVQARPRLLGCPISIQSTRTQTHTHTHTAQAAMAFGRRKGSGRVGGQPSAVLLLAALVLMTMGGAAYAFLPPINARAMTTPRRTAAARMMAAEGAGESQVGGCVCV